MGGKTKQSPLRLSWLATVGLRQHVFDFLQNLSILLESGLDLVNSIGVLHDETGSRRMRTVLAYLKDQIESGMKLSEALKDVHVVQAHTLALVASGESSGRLTENLTIAIVQQQRVNRFVTRTRSAMIYPTFVIVLTAVIGIGTSWFILPTITSGFAGLNIEMPVSTRVVISIGDFFNIYGWRVVPSLLGAIILGGIVIALWPRARRFGVRMLFSLPAIHNIVRDNEMTRLGYVLGGLLEAGLPIVAALDSLALTSSLNPYRALYGNLRSSIEAGSSFREVFHELRHLDRLVPPTAQHLIVAAERGGRLPEALIRIGTIYEERTNGHIRTLTTLLEPLIIIAVGIAVLVVALSIIMPIYSLIGGIR